MDLCTAAKTGTLDEMRQALNNGADINYRDAVFGRTPLSWAATRGRWVVVDFLLVQEGIDLNLKDNSGRTPLSWAVEKGSKRVVLLLLQKEGIDLNSKDNSGGTPLSWAVKKRNKEVVVLLLGINDIELNSTDNDGQTPLLLAAKMGDGDIVELLLEKDGIDLNSKDSDRQTPLLLAAKMGHDDIVELLVERHGIELNSQDNGGRTALSWAAEKGRESNRFFEQDKNIKVVRLLLKKVGIDFNLKDNSGRTALSWAAEKGNGGVVSLLLQMKGEINQHLKDNDGRSPLSLAAANDHITVIKLLAHNDNLILHTLIQEKRETLVQELLNKKYVEHNAQDHLGKTPLHIAIAGGYENVVGFLMLHGATDINLKDNDGVTPLRLAMRLQDQKKRRCLIKLLLEKSALTENIMVHDWRQAYEKQLSNVVILSDRIDGKKSVGFKAEEELDGETPIIETGRRLLLLSYNRDWLTRYIGVPGVELPDYKLVVSLPSQDGGQGDRIYVAVQFPSEQDLNHRRASTAWETCVIAWTMAPTPNTGVNPYWKSIDHFSMMPFGWIPDSGIEFFKQFVRHLKGRWLVLCDLAMDHLAGRRDYQLSSEGTNPQLIRNLANDAKRWGDFRSKVQDQVQEARNFAIEYSKRYNENKPLKDTLQLLVDWEDIVINRIDKLDQTVRDLLQIEFAWVSMGEARISTRLGQNVMLLTYVTIFYLPLAFCAALWAIPDIAESGTRNPFIITAVMVGLATYVTVYNLENISGVLGRVYQTLGLLKGKPTRDRPVELAEV